MNKGLLQIAEGFAMVAEGYRKMASEAKEYLKVEYEDEDTLIQTLIDSSEILCRDIIRRDILPENAAVKTAVLYAVGVMFENRGTNEETEKMIPTLKNILSSNREEVF